MSSIYDNIKQQFQTGSMVIKLIMVNVGFFVVSLLISIFIKLWVPSFEISSYYGASSNLWELVFKPWTLVTYMFSHSLSGIGHLFWNMIMLYFAGTYFVNKLGNKKLLSVYLIGGFTGFFFFSFCFSFLPAFSIKGYSFLVGASASVTAIMIVIAVLFPNDEIKLMFIPQPIKLIYVIGFFILLDIIKFQSSIGIQGSNDGGWLSHLGGAIFGYIYAVKKREGRNVLRKFETFLDTIFSLNLSNFFVKDKKTKLKVERGGKPPRDDYSYNEMKVKNQEITDVILDKISKSGYDSLSKKEKDFLFRQSKK